MRIGIMTFWWSQDNYGQLLQCYALQKYLRDLGHDAFVIRNYLKTSGGVILKVKKYLFHPWLVVEGVKRVYWRKKGEKKNRRFYRHFDEFRKNRIRFSSEEYFALSDLQQDPPEADMYIVGSDQVWNMIGLDLADNQQSYFLQFGSDDVLRVAYAPSFGTSELSREHLKTISNWLRQFTAVSCREQSGVEICEKIGVNATWVEDPTLLIEKLHWDSLCVDPLDGAPYVFVYLLSWQTNVSMRTIQKWAIQKGLRVIYVKGNRESQMDFDDADVADVNPSIEEWLGFIRHASFVITNSFHCCVFSAVFRRHLLVSLLSGREASSNNRITDLCKLVGNEMMVSADSLLAGVYDCGEMVLPENIGDAGRKFLAEAIKGER